MYYNNGEIVYLCGLAVSWIAAFFITSIFLRKLLKVDISQLKLIGSLVIFTISFIVIFIIIAIIIAHTLPNQGFGR